MIVKHNSFAKPSKWQEHPSVDLAGAAVGKLLRRVNPPLQQKIYPEDVWRAMARGTV